MLYLVLPSLAIRWIDLPNGTLKRVPDGVDLGGLDWLESTAIRHATTDSLRIALRYGRACSRGIVVAASEFAEQNRASEIARTTAAAQTAHAQLRRTNGAVMEQLIPGWTENAQQLDARVAESAAAAIEESLADIREQIQSREPDPVLVAHWKTLHGALPNPL